MRIKAYSKGEVIASIAEFDEELRRGTKYFYERGGLQHYSWLANRNFSWLKAMIMSGHIARAVRNPAVAWLESDGPHPVFTWDKYIGSTIGVPDEEFPHYAKWVRQQIKASEAVPTALAESK